MWRCLLLGALVSSGLCLAQEPIRVDVKLVNIAFSVRDAHGALVNSLEKEDFEILEEPFRRRFPSSREARMSP
jgi:hypothetical protein